MQVTRLYWRAIRPLARGASCKSDSLSVLELLQQEASSAAGVPVLEGYNWAGVQAATSKQHMVRAAGKTQKSACLLPGSLVNVQRYRLCKGAHGIKPLPTESDRPGMQVHVIDADATASSSKLDAPRSGSHLLEGQSVDVELVGLALRALVGDHEGDGVGLPVGVALAGK